MVRLPHPQPKRDASAYTERCCILPLAGNGCVLLLRSSDAILVLLCPHFPHFLPRQYVCEPNRLGHACSDEAIAHHRNTGLEAYAVTHRDKYWILWWRSLLDCRGSGSWQQRCAPSSARDANHGNKSVRCGLALCLYVVATETVDHVQVLGHSNGHLVRKDTPH